MQRILSIVDACDKTLLSLAEKISKKLNWLTGKDNFFFAKFFVIVAGMWAALMHFLSQNYIAAFSEMLFAWIILGIIHRTEREFDRASFDGALSKFIFDRIRLYRVFLVITIIIFWIYAIFSSGSVIVEITIFFENVVFAIALYLASVLKPPFSKSQVKEWLKRFKFSSSPTMAPQSVPRSN